MNDKQREDYKKHITHDLAIDFIDGLLRDVMDFSLADLIYSRGLSLPEDRLFATIHDLKVYKHQTIEYSELKKCLKKAIK